MFSFDLISIVLTILCFLYMHQRCNSDSAVDTAWNFDDGTDLQGWADASAAEMQIAASLNSGEMQGIILGLTPNIASPLMSISVTPRHYIVIRMAYSGRNVLGELLISYGFLNEASQDYSSYRKFTWSDYSTPVAVSGSISSGSGADISATTDSDPSTYYLSAAPAGIFIVYDLGDYRWVTAVKITPLQGSDSPRRCILQRSTSFTDRGPFATVAAFTLNVTTSAGATSVQTITGLSAHARYWKLFIIDNDGGIGVGIRDVSFAGYKDSVDVVPFSLNNLGDYVTYYLPINHRNISTPIVRMRLDLFQNALHYTDSLLRLGSFQVDFVRIARAPEVYKVTGCLNLFYSNSSLINPSYSIRSVLQLINGNLPLRYYTQDSANNSSPYATTYNCPLNGGIKITIVGINFGESAKVLVGSNECPVIHRNSIAKDGIVMDTIICTLPATVSDALSAIVRVQNGVLPGLFYEYPGIAYGVNPQTPAPPIIVNVGSCRVDLIWHPPGNIFDALIVTGYKIAWSTSNSSSRGGTMTLGNVTTTSIRGLDPGTFYSFRIAAMSESLLPFNNAALPTDLYGRRSPSSDAAFSTYSLFPSSIKTLDQDFIFPFFNADHTLNHSIDGIPASSIAPATLGPTGQYGGEGQYGLALIGTANVQNCNASTTCCDGYNTTIGAASCTYHSLVNAVLLNRQFDMVFVVDGEISKRIPSNKLFEGGGLPSSSVFTNVAFSSVTGASLINAACGPAIRLTSSAAREAGAIWYSRKVNVAEGFDTTFAFEISNPSSECGVMDDVQTYCRSRGSDGLAFVIQDSGSGLRSLGGEGSGLGNSGIDNALSVEFDTHMNYENLDLYENHISVLTQGYRYNLISDHVRALASTTRTADLTDGPRRVRIRYDPNFDPAVRTHESFIISGYASWFMENADYSNGGQGNWDAGFGLLYVYIDDLYSPVIITPLNLDATLDLDNGRAHVGFTAATGTNHWQVHDLLDWSWTSLFLNKDYTPPLVLNVEGGHKCTDESVCVKLADHDHYLRTDTLYGRYYDGVKGW